MIFNVKYSFLKCSKVVFEYKRKVFASTATVQMTQSVLILSRFKNKEINNHKKYFLNNLKESKQF